MARGAAVTRKAIGAVLLGLVVYLGSATPARAQTPDDDPTLTFQWDDPGMQEAFRSCMALVEWVTHGKHGSQPAKGFFPWQDVPGRIDRGLWRRAADGGYFSTPRFQNFTFRPRCDLLLPSDYESRISIRYYSEVYARCLAVIGGDTDHARPQIVPAWYWEVSLKSGDCYLLLPLGAYGLGDDENEWSRWTTDDEVDYPDSNADPAVTGAYRQCLDFIDWRMEHGQTRNVFDPLGDRYEDPPDDAVPDTMWQEAIDFFVNHSSGDKTEPANWHPNCELLLVVSHCQPSGPANRSLLPEECLGPHPIASYDIGYSQYDDPAEKGIASISRNLWGGTTNFAYTIGKGGVQVANWAVDWGYRFDARKYDPLAISIGDRYQNNLLGHPGFRLRELLWLFLAAWAGVTAFRGRLAVAGTEVLITIVLLLVSGVLMQQRQMYMDATWNLMDKASTALLVAGMGDDPGDDGAAQRDHLVRQLQERIQFTFVEEPYDYLNWGRSLGDANDPENPRRDCATLRFAILAHGPHGADPWPRRQMATNPRCRDLAEFNRNPDGTRLLGAILVMVSAVLVAVLLTITSLTVVVAKLIALVAFGLVPFAALAVILPAHGRRFAWSLGATILQVVLAVVGMSFLLSLLLLSLTALADLTGDVDLIERFVLMDLVVIIVFAARRSMLSGGQDFAARLSELLSSPRASGTTWSSAAATARPGLRLLNVDRTAAYTTYAAARGASGPAQVAVASTLLRLHERRTAGRSYRNLQRVAAWKRSRNTQSQRWVGHHSGSRRIDRSRPETIPTRRQPLP